MDAIGTGSLKLVVLLDESLRAHIEDALCVLAPDHRPLGHRAWVAYTRATTAELRDRIVAAAPGASVLIAEFERWSAYGAGVDTAWLSRRGH